MTMPTVLLPPAGWNVITPTGDATIEDLDVGVHPVREFSDVVVVVSDAPRAYMVVERLCPHKQLDLSVEGDVRAAPTGLWCRHNRAWCATSGVVMRGRTRDLYVYPSGLFSGVLYINREWVLS